MKKNLQHSLLMYVQAPNRVQWTMVPILRAPNSNWFYLNQWNLATSSKSLRIRLAADYNIDKKCSHQLWWFDTYQVFCLHRSTQLYMYYALVGNTSLSVLHLLDNLVLTKCLLLGPHNVGTWKKRRKNVDDFKWKAVKSQNAK